MTVYIPLASCNILSEILIIAYYGCYGNRDKEIVVTLMILYPRVHHCENVVSKISFIYCLYGGGGGGWELNWQVLRYSILCICKVPNLQVAEQSLSFLQNKIGL